MKHFKLIALALMLLPALAQSQDAPEAIEPEPAERVPLADESLILDVTRAGERYVAVGARGHVLVSGDGKEWTQAEHVPVRATLTRVDFSDGQLWAVGHDTTIIHSSDLGRTWTLQYFEPLWDGPISEQPLLDVHFFDANRGLAVGAYGLIMHTGDGGQNWTVEHMGDVMVSEAINWKQPGTESEQGDQDAASADEYYDASQDFDRGCYEFMECHLNAILALGDERVMLAAESGYGFRSSDGGETWESFRFPYPGSMFGLASANGGIIAFGLRGNVQLSRDYGGSWEKLDSGIESTLLDGAVNSGGDVIMVGAGATVLDYEPGSGRFEVSQDRLGSDYAALAFDKDGGLILAGENGLTNE